MDSVVIQPLTDEEMSSLGLTDSDVWMLKHGEDVYGPYEPTSLHQHALENKEFYSTLEASIVAEENWVPFFQAQAFKERKPQLVSNSTLRPPEHFWVAHKGQRQGPHLQSKIQSMIDAGELVATSLVTSDEGETWQKIYELKYFTCQKHSSDKLPSAPDEDYMSSSEKSVEEVTHFQDPLKDGLASLAFLGHKNASFKIENVAIPKANKWGVPETARRPITLKQKKIAAVSAVAMATLVIVMSWGPSKENLSEDDFVATTKSSKRNYDDIELVPSGSSLLDDEAPRRARVSGNRIPATATPMPVPSPRAMNGARNNLARMQETHDDYIEPMEAPAQIEPEIGLYPDEGTPEAAYPDDAGIERTPSSQPEPNDDGYRMEESPIENSQEAPREIEEIGDF